QQLRHDRQVDEGRRAKFSTIRVLRAVADHIDAFLASPALDGEVRLAARRAPRSWHALGDRCAGVAVGGEADEELALAQLHAAHAIAREAVALLTCLWAYRNLAVCAVWPRHA